MEQNKKKKLFMAGVLLAGIILTVVVVSKATNGSLLQGKLVLRGAAESFSSPAVGGIIEVGGACKVTTCDLNAKLDTILDNLNNYEKLTINEIRGIPDVYTRLNNKLNELQLHVLNGTSDLKNYLSTALGNKLDQLQTTVWSASYGSANDLRNYLSTALGNRLDEIINNQQTLLNYLSTAVVNKLDLLLAK